MKNRSNRTWLSFAAAAAFLGLAPTHANAAALDVEVSDVLNVLHNCTPHLIALVLIVIGAIVLNIVCRKTPQPKRSLLRMQTVVAALVSGGIVLNLICVGPLSTLLDVMSNTVGEVSDESKQEAESLISEMATEGIVLVKNDGSLPLPSATKTLNVFGWASTCPVYGGTGSGAVDTSTAVTLLSGLEAGGYQLNPTLTKLYTDYAAARGEATMSSVDWTLPEPTADAYTDAIMDEAKNFSDTAVIVIGRVGGEGSDLPLDFGKQNPDGSDYYTISSNSPDYKEFEAGQHYLELSHTEHDLVELVCSSFEQVVVIYNGANAFELGWVENYPQIRGVLCIPGAGQTGFVALGSILNGTANPSGKLADTYVYDLTATPAYQNFGSFTYENMNELGWLEQNPFTGESKQNPVNFVNYVDSIYVGYKFYETAYAEAQLGHMDFDYDSVVQYPFGYGLSYTTFQQEMSGLTVNGDQISFTVTVTNTGRVAGKAVVEVYYDPPYTNQGLEKAAANLLDFGKTALLAPNASETLTFTLKAEDMASYDADGAGCYVLDAGDYNISIRSDAHTILAQQVYAVDHQVVYNESNPRSTDHTAAVNQFDFALGDNVTYLSRADGFANYAAATAAPTNFSMDPQRKAAYTNITNYDIDSMNDPDDVMPTTGAKNGLVLAQLRGLDYDDPKWDSLLDELSITDMVSLIAGGGYQTAAVDTIQKKGTTDNDGPATIYNNYTGATGSAYPCETLLANTWNKDLALAMGRSVGKQADEMDVSGWYAPAINIHRTAFGGRNFEYYSEDSVLSGKLAAQELLGANEYGVYGYIKHFALNDQETNRIYQICTWSTEQAIREVYLKAFEIAVKEGKTGGVMDAHSFIGDKWTGAISALNNTVLRNEWGFRGFVSTDMFAGYGYYDADVGIRNGVDSMLNPMGMPDATVTDQTSATSVLAMRRACHNILYTVVNSRAYADQNGYQMVLWKKIMIGADVALLVLCIALEALSIVKYRKNSR